MSLSNTPDQTKDNLKVALDDFESREGTFGYLENRKMNLALEEVLMPFFYDICARITFATILIFGLKSDETVVNNMVRMVV